MLLHKFCLSLALVCASLLLPAAAMAGSVCRTIGFVGFEAEAGRAAETLGAPTRNISEIAVYIEETQGVFYYQTNYISPGERYPAKIVISTELPLRDALINLVARPGEAAAGLPEAILAGRQLAVYRVTSDNLPGTNPVIAGLGADGKTIQIASADGK